ncbi:MAG: type II secretion system protein GspG [Armatimonadia bacterium]
MRHSTRHGLAATQLLYALMVVMVGAFAFYYYVNDRSESAKRGLTIKRMTAIEAALEKYCFDCGGELPSQEQGLEALLALPKDDAPHGWAGPYLTKPADLQDGWGRPFKFMCPGKMLKGSELRRPYDLASYGKDGCEGGEDLDRDVCNWDRTTMIP